MGRKRKRATKVSSTASAAEHRGVWPRAIEEELLAYLDSGVAFLDPETKAEIERKYEDIDEEISQHLNSVHEDDNYSPESLRQFSAAQVRDKLHRLWSAYCREGLDGRKWRVIYKDGTSCLTSSKDPELKARVARRTGAIKIKWLERYLRSPRKTRAGSQINRETYPPPRGSRSVSGSCPIAQPGRLKVPEQHPLRQRCMASGDDNAPDTSSTSIGQDLASNIKMENAGIDTNILDIPDSTSEKTLSCKDPQLSVSEEPEIYGTPSARFAPFSDCIEDSGEAGMLRTMTPLNPIERLSELEGELSARREESAQDIDHWKAMYRTICDENTKLEALRDESAQEVDFWKAKYRTAENENTELERECNVLIVKLGALREAKAELTVNDFLKSQATIDNLVEQIHLQRRVQSLKRRVSVNVEKQTFPNISKLMQDIGSHLRGALKGGHFVCLPALPDLPQEHPLRALVEQAFGFSWASNDASSFLEECRHSSDKQQCSLLALSGAALAQWVFNRSQADLVFDRYHGDSSRCSTNRYRHAIEIVAMEDPEFARAIDLEVHTKIAEEASFEHFRMRKARTLALKLQEALAPLWNGNQAETGELGEGNDSDQEITEQLTTVFDKALDVQCRLILTGHQYECVWYPPGDPFDETNMNLYKFEGAAGTKPSTIRLTLLPGISHVVNSTRKLGVDFGGFADSQRWTQGRGVCLVQPLVWHDCS